MPLRPACLVYERNVIEYGERTGEVFWLVLVRTGRRGKGTLLVYGDGWGTEVYPLRARLIEGARGLGYEVVNPDEPLAPNEPQQLVLLSELE